MPDHDHNTSTSPRTTLAEWLAREPYTLVMSSGFFSFFAHAGMLRALEERNLRPSALAGSSAGALVAGMSAAGMEATEICQTLERVRRADFWDPRPGLGLLRGHRFCQLLRRELPTNDFAGCRVPLGVSVFDLAARHTRVIRHGELAPAVQASCAVPLMFQPVWLDGRPHWDGGIADRAGLGDLARGERTLHHHITSRSPWRRPGSPAMTLINRPNLVTLCIDELPRPNPFRLERGPEAMRAARAATLAALDEPVANAVIRIVASAPTDSSRERPTALFS